MKKFTLATVIVSSILFAGMANAANYYWTGAVSGDMSDPDNYNDENDLPASVLPGESDTIFFSIGADVVANMPTNDLASSRFGNLRFTVDGYTLASTADLYYKRIVVEPDLTLTNRSALSWNASDGSRVEVQARAKFIHEGTFGNSPGDFFLQMGTDAEFVYAGSNKATKFRDTTNNHIITLQGGRNHGMFMEITGGTPRLRTTGGPVTYSGPSQISWQTGNMRIGGVGSGDIELISNFEPNWGGGKNIFVEEIVFKVQRFLTDHTRSSGTENFTKWGNGTLVFTGNGGFEQSGNSDKNGLLFVLENGTTCFNARFRNFSRSQANIEGLRVASAARVEGTGTYDTREGGNNKSAEIRGTIAPGCSHMDEAREVGALTYIGTNFIFRAGSRLEIKAAHDKQAKLVLDASPVTIENNVALEVIPLSNLTAPAPFTILENVGGAPIVGTFANLPEGALLVAEANDITKKYRITYFGGAGNDVDLIPVPDSTVLIIR